DQAVVFPQHLRSQRQIGRQGDDVHGCSLHGTARAAARGPGSPWPLKAPQDRRRLGGRMGRDPPPDRHAAAGGASLGWFSSIFLVSISHSTAEKVARKKNPPGRFPGLVRLLPPTDDGAFDPAACAAASSGVTAPRPAWARA